MLDNLRNQASFQDDQEPSDPNESKPPRQRRQLRSIDEITHMTARQRFALAIMFLIVVCLLGTMLLIIGGKVVPPFMN
jgi:hypothetical protein